MKKLELLQQMIRTCTYRKSENKKRWKYISIIMIQIVLVRRHFVAGLTLITSISRAFNPRRCFNRFLVCCMEFNYIPSRLDMDFGIKTWHTMINSLKNLFTLYICFKLHHEKLDIDFCYIYSHQGIHNSVFLYNILDFVIILIILSFTSCFYCKFLIL